jgi:hypothetical protein
MSYHSSAFPIEVATISLVMSFCFEPARGIPGNSTGADTVIPNPFPFSFSPIALALPAWRSTRRAASRPDPRTGPP